MEFCNSTSENYINSESQCGDAHIDPLLVIIYREEKERGNFTKYELHNFESKPKLFKTENILSIPYEDILFNNDVKKQAKKSQDFKTNIEKLQNTESMKLSTLLLQLLTTVEWQNTTFICQDSSSIIYVS